jgi:hypothetical protein
VEGRERHTTFSRVKSLNDSDAAISGSTILTNTSARPRGSLNRFRSGGVRTCGGGGDRGVVARGYAPMEDVPLTCGNESSSWTVNGDRDRCVE